MQKFSCESTDIEGLKIINPFYLEDERGYFLKSFEKDVFKEFGLENEIYEDFESYSKKSVIRGLHFQLKHPQVKLVRCVMGHIFDVAVDLRKDSKTFGQWQGFDLSDKNTKSLYIPKGFAHGFLVLSDYAIVSYKCVGKFLSEYDSGIVWNDKDLNIAWNIKEPIVSEKDCSLMRFIDFEAL